MKAEFNEQGALIVSAENNTERVALKSWYSEFNQGSGKSTLAFDFDSYKKKSAPTDGQ